MRFLSADRLEVIRLADQMDATGDLTKDVLDIFAHTDRILVHAVENGVMPLASVPHSHLRPTDTISTVRKGDDHASCKRGKSCKGRA